MTSISLEWCFGRHRWRKHGNRRGDEASYASAERPSFYTDAGDVTCRPLRKKCRWRIEEGVELRELVAPVGITADGAQYTLTLQEMKISGEDSRGRANILPDEGKTRELRVEHVFKATGALPGEDWFNPSDKTKISLALSHTLLVCPDSGPALVFGGDLTNETKSVAHAVASGKQAAMALDILFHRRY